MVEIQAFLKAIEKIPATEKIPAAEFAKIVNGFRLLRTGCHARDVASYIEPAYEQK